MEVFVITKIKKLTTDFNLNIIKIQNSFLSKEKDEWTGFEYCAYYSTYALAKDRLRRGATNKLDFPKLPNYQNKEPRIVKMEWYEENRPDLAKSQDLIKILYSENNT